MGVISYEEYKKKKKKQLDEEHEIWRLQQKNQKIKEENESQTKLLDKGQGSFGNKAAFTISDFILNATKGGIGAAEGVTDFVRRRTADVADFVGWDSKAKQLRKTANQNTTEGIASDLEHILYGDLSGSLSEDEVDSYDTLHKNSVLTDRSRGIAQSVGYSVTNAAMSTAMGGGNVGSLILTGVSAGGSAESRAIEQGMDVDDAFIYGILSGSGEAVSEAFFGGVGKFTKALGYGKGALDDVLIENVTKRIGSNVLRSLTSFGLRAGGEGFEEILSAAFDTAAQKISGMDERSLKEIWQDQNVGQAFVDGVISSMFSSSPRLVSSIATGTNYDNGTTKNEQKVIEDIIDQRTQGQKLSNKERGNLRQQITKDLIEGRIAGSEIDRALQNTETTWNQNKDRYITRTVINENTKFTTTDDDLKIDKKQLNKNANLEDVQNKIKVLEQDFLNANNDVRNTTSSHELFDEMKRMIVATGEQQRLTSNKQMAEDGDLKLLTNKKGEPIRNGRGELQYVKADTGQLVTINGYHTKDGMVLNADTHQAFESTMGHELGESLKANTPEIYKQLRDLAVEVGRADGTLTKETFDAIKSTYGELGTNTDNYLDEYVNDKIGEMFKSDSSMFQEIGKKPNIARRLLNEIKYLIQKFTAGSPEQKRLLEAQHNLKKALNESVRNLNINQEQKTENIQQQTTEDIAPIKEQVKEKPKEFTEVTDEDLFNVNMEEVESEIWHDNYDLDGDLETLPENTATFTDINHNNYQLKDGNTLYIETPAEYGKFKNGNTNYNEQLHKEIVFTIEDNNGNIIDEYSIKNEDGKFTKEDILNAIKHMTYDDSNKVADGQLDIFDNVHRNDGHKYSLSDNPKIFNEVKKYDSMEDFIFDSNISYEELESAGLGGLGEIVEYYNNKNKPILKDYKNTNESASFTEDRLDSVISESISDYDDNYARAYITYMSPEQFLGLTASEQTMERLNQETEELDVEKLAKERQHIFLDVNLETGKVTGHEGRHRMLALQRAGIKEVEMVIYPDSGTYDRSNAPRIDSMNLIGQDFRIGKGTDTTIGEMIPVSKATQNELRSQNREDSGIRYSLSQDNQGNEELTLYHGTSLNAAFKIQKYGFVSNSAIGAEGGAANYNYFTNSRINAETYRDRKDRYSGQLLRVKKTADMQIDDRIAGHKKGEYDFRTQRNVTPDEIQILTKDGYWTPISNYDLYTDTPAEQKVIDKSLLYDDDGNKISDVKYSLSSTDNQGRELTEQQQEHFKDSAIRVKPGKFGNPVISEDGQLFEVYHGTNNEFYVFDDDYRGSSSGDMGWYGPGYYFAFSEKEAKTYGSNVIKAYLNIKNPFFFQEEMQSYDNKYSGDVGFDFASFMINMKNKFPDISNRETIKYQEYSDELGDWEIKDISIKDVGQKIEDVYKSDNFKLVTISDNGVDKYQYVYQENIDNFNVPKDIKELIENNMIYNKRDAKFAVENSQYYKADVKELEKLLEYFDKNEFDFSRNFVGNANENKELMEDSRLSEAAWYVRENVYRNLDQHMPEYYMQYLGKDIRQELEKNGYDGVAQSRYGDEIVAFYPEQIKDVDNKAPTSNPDIRYSLSDNQNERISNLQKEYDELDKTRDVTFDERDNLREELKQLINSEEYKNAQSKFMDMVKQDKMTPDEISKTKEYELMAQEEQIRKRLKDYDADVKYMTDEMTKISEMIENEEKGHRTPEKAIEQAKEIFGITDDFREAGYLLQDGSLLDFSGRNQGSNYYGKRGLDHRDINEIGYDMDEFIEMGNIRMKPEAGGFELSQPLTKEQKSKLRDYLSTINDEMNVDITKDGHVMYDSATYKKGTPTSKIFSDIDYYFENGKFPQKSEYADFYYSLSSPDDIAPFGEGIKSEQIKPRDIQQTIQNSVQEAIAPIREQIQQIADEVIKSENLDDIELNLEPFMDMINGDNGQVLSNINKNYDQIMTNLQEQGLPKDAAQSFLQNMVHKYDQAFNRVKQRMSEKDRNKVQKMILDLQEKFTNRNAIIDKLAKDSGNQMIKYKGDLANNSFGQAQYNVQMAQTDLNGNEIGKSINGLFEQAEKQGLGAVLDDYLFHKSNIERHAVGKGSQVPANVSEQLIMDYEKSYPQLKEWSKGFETYFDNLLQLEVDSGLIDQDTYNLLRGEEGIYRSYVPFFENETEKRYYDDAGDLKPIKPLKRAKGGANQSKLMGMKQAMTKQTMAVWQSMRTNQLYQEIINTLGGEEGLGFIVRNDPSNLSQSLYTDQDGNKFLTAYVNGQEMSTKISDELYNELSRKSENAIKEFEDKYSLLIKPLQGISNFRRNVLTSYNPIFALYKNPIKDIGDATLYSKHTAQMLKGLLPSYYQLLRNKTKEAKQFRALYGGGEYSGFGKRYARATEIIELAPRFAEFKASLKAGESVEQALYNARDITTNFGRGGYITKALNRNGATFLNASVQGFSKFYRNFAEQPNAGQFAMAVGKAALLGVVPAVFNDLAFGGGGDDKDEDYEALPDYIKDNYYLFKKRNGDFIRIPKGRALSVMGSAARRTIEAANGGEFGFKDYFKNAWSQIGPVEIGGNPLDNTIIAPLVQAWNPFGEKKSGGNTPGRAWYGGDIVPYRLQGERPEDQSDASVDKMSIWLGEKLGISPYKINYVIDQYSGGLGDVILPMMTEETKSGAETVGEHIIAPIKDQVVVNSTDDNKYAGEFYSTKKALYTGSKATDKELLKAQYMNDVSKEMSSLYAEQQQIQANEKLDKKTKYAKVQEIQKQINEIAKNGLELSDKITVQGNYADVGEDREYYKNTKGEWTAISQDDMATIETLGLTNSEKSAYFDVKNQIYNLDNDYKAKKEGKSEAESLQIGIQQKKDRIETIKSSTLPDSAKYAMYDTKYDDKLLPYYEDLGFNANDYLTYKQQIFSADKDKNGKAIKDSKKKKIENYLYNSNMPYEQKIILYKKEYKADSYFDDEIFNYINNSNLDYTSKTKILDELGIKYR